jgi:hypothetical protein
MFRWSAAELRSALLATAILSACTPVEEDECQRTVIEDPNTGMDLPVVSLGCFSPPDPDSKVPSGTACDGLDAQFGGVVELANGMSPLLGAFFTEDNVIVVTKDRVALVDRQGKQLALVRWVNELHVNGRLDTAAFDGSTLVVTAKGLVVSYDTNLREVARFALPGECSSSVLLSGNRFVCGDPDEYERVFYVYDALSGAFLQLTTRFGFEAGPMSRIPGRDAFVSVSTEESSKKLLMYAVDSAGSVTMTGNSSNSNRGTFSISPLLAFHGDPATHLITDAGELVCLTPEDCGRPTSSLLLDGDARHLPQGRAFAAMDVDAAGKLHAILRSGEGSVAERIDVATQTVEASMPFEDPGHSAFTLLRADPQGGVLLACGPGHRVLLLPNAP